MTQSATNENSPTVRCPIEREQVIEMTHELFGPMFGLEINCNEEGCTVSFAPKAWQASVTLNGDWNAEVQTIIPGKLAQRLACDMFDMTPDELTDIEMADAMGEVVNIIGGNVKGIVGQESNLSLPCVAQYQAAIDDPNLTVGFNCENENLLVLVKQG